MDKNLLEYEMKKRGVSVDEICEKAGFSRSAFYRKIKGTSQFTLGEIKKIMEILQIDSPMKIFFAEQVS